MAIVLSTTCRNNMLDAITTSVGNGGKLKIYDGTKPAGPGTAITTQVLLAELTCGTPFAGSASSGVLTLSAITSATASASSSATWFRITTSGGSTGVIDGSVTATGGGGDLTFPTTTVTSGITVSISSATFTAGNG